MKKFLILAIVCLAAFGCKNTVEIKERVVEADKPDAVSLTMAGTTTDAVKVK